MNSSSPHLVKTELLQQIAQSLGLAMVYPEIKRGFVVNKRKCGELYLSFHETSLLQIRDRILSKDPVEQTLGQALLVGIIKVIAFRFQFVLLPDYQEIMAWAEPAHLRIVNEAVSSWQKAQGVLAFSNLSDQGHTGARLIGAATVVIAELLALLPQKTWREFLAQN